MNYFLDTDICIYLMKGKNRPLLEKFHQFTLTEIAIPTIVLSELKFGVAKSSRVAANQKRLEAFLAPFQITPYPEKAAALYGDIRSALEKKGTPIGSNDMLIAAHVLAEGVTLVTNNEREFLRVPDLKVENWTH